MEFIDYSGVYQIAIPIVIIAIVFEVIFSISRKRELYKAGDFFGTAGLLLGNILVSLLFQGSVLSLYFFLYEFRLLNLVDKFPLVLLWAITFIAIDFVFYWYHRCSHRVRILWAIHMNHHSSTEMNFSVSFRQAWFGPISKVPFFISLPLIGFDPSITAIAGVISTFWGVVGHTQLIGKLGWMDGIFNTPSNHRVHHGKNKEYIDKNYGNLLIIWDRFFRTYQREEKKVIFGLVQDLNTNNPVEITFYSWKEIITDLKKASSWRQIVTIIFGVPYPNSDVGKNSSLRPSLIKDLSG